MTALIDARPPGVDAYFRPGNVFTLTVKWPTGSLAGRTFTATLDAAPLTLGVNVDTMTIVASAAQTAAAAESAVFKLTETTGGMSQVLIAGRWSPSTRASATSSLAVTVNAGAASVNVTVVAPPPALPFITVPSDWGGRWRQALSQASSRLVRVAFLADSIGTGLYARNISASGTRWVGGYVHQVRDALQAVYGDGGSGWADNRTNRGVFGGMELGAETGSWAATLSGVNDAPRKPATPGNGATETFPFDGTIVDIVTQTDTGFGSLTYSIDAGTGVVLNQNIADSIQVTTVTGLAPGAHTLKFTASTGDSKPIGVRGRNATGVIVDNMSSGGRAYSAGATGGLITAATDGWATETTMSNTATALGPIDLLIMVLGVNDLTTSTDIWASSTGWHALGTMFERAQSLATAYGNPPEMVVVIPHFGAGETDITTLEGPQLAVQLRTFAASTGAAVVDVWGAGRRSWNYWDSLGYWPDPFLTGKDAVHPNIGGHTVYADLIKSVIMP